MAGIYIHIPFCESRCIYCDFYSTTSLKWKDDYVDAFENIVYIDDIGLDEEESLEDSTIELYPGLRTVSLKNKK